jgi:hypothetical protein
MTPSFRVPLAILLILAAAACAPVTPVIQEVVASRTPTPAELYYPLDTRTGVEVIDRVLDAVASGDRQALFSVVEFTNAECTKAEGLGGPPKCREGEAEGSPVEALPFLSSEGHHLRRDEINQWNEIDAIGLYAIYEVNAAAITSEQYFPVGKYAILLIMEGSDPALALRIGKRGIVRVDTILDASPQALNAMIEREASKVILAPVGQ